MAGTGHSDFLTELSSWTGTLSACAFVAPLFYRGPTERCLQFVHTGKNKLQAREVRKLFGAVAPLPSTWTGV